MDNQDQYLQAYKALFDKYNQDNASAQALQPTAQSIGDIKDKQALGALVSNLFKAQSLVGSVGGKATQNPDVNYSQYADLDKQALDERAKLGQQKQQQALLGLNTGRQQQSDLMGAQQFGQQQQLGGLNIQGKQQQLAQEALLNPLEVASKRQGLAQGAQGLALGKYQLNDLQQQNQFSPEASRVRSSLLNQEKSQAQSRGDMGTVTQIDQELASLDQANRVYQTAQALPDTNPKKQQLLSKLGNVVSLKKAGQLNNLDSSTLSLLTNPQLTPGQKQVDDSFGKDYSEYLTSGGSAAVDRTLKQLQDVSDSLGSGKATSGPLQGYLSEHAPNLRAGLSPDSVTAQQKVEQAATASVKALVGARVTQGEFNRIISQSYNPALPAAENKRRIDTLIQQIKSQQQEKDSAGKYFEQRGTLKGFQVTPSQQAGVPAQAPSSPSKPKSVTQNGHTYILNESTGKYE